MIPEGQGIEVDYCPRCRGVWVDRVELDKIIERAAQTWVAPESQMSQQRARGYRERRAYEDHDAGDQRYRYGKKKRGFLGERFDLDGNCSGALSYS